MTVDDDTAAATPQTEATAPATRPDDVPEKFWDAEAGSVRTDALIKSYGELERRLGEPASEVPESADGYDIRPPEGFEELLASDAGVNARLYEAGFSQSQAALVYELAAERLLPLVERFAGDLQVSGEQAALARHFGGDEAWKQARPQIEAWGRANLEDGTFQALSCSADGVLAMHRMMRSGEPAVLRGAGSGGDAPNEPELRRMMRDPRYWRDEDPAYIARVRRGFEALYPN